MGAVPHFILIHFGQEGGCCLAPRDSAQLAGDPATIPWGVFNLVGLVIHNGVALSGLSRED